MRQLEPISDDPLTIAIAPPPDETPEQRRVREAAEAEAKRINDKINEQIRREREQMRTAGRPLKMLLVGQSGSGKTAMAKRFQLMYASSYEQRKAAWRPIVLLNLVRNVNVILSHLSSEMKLDIHDADNSQEGLQAPRPRQTFDNINLKFTDKHWQLREELAPLAHIQHRLEEKLGLANRDLQTTSVDVAAPFGEDVDRSLSCRSQYHGVHKNSVYSPNGWESLLSRLYREDVELAKYRGAIKELWEDDIVGEVLSRRKVRLEDAPGFFIKDVDRIARLDYQPTDDDVLRAHLRTRTLGVQEYRFSIDRRTAMGEECRLYELGGTRSSSSAWYPYFDDVDAIIFLAPISTFDENLAEDERVNKLEDSYLLWRSVCSSKLLARKCLILILNKCDLLQAKLQRGVRIRDSIPSYGDRPNDFATAAEYFRQHFRKIFNLKHRRPFRCHLTSAIDTRAPVTILESVREAILREYLAQQDLIV